MKQYGFGVDLGGTTCKIGLFQTDGVLLEKWEIPTVVSDGGKYIITDIATAIQKKMTEKSIPGDYVQGIGIGVPGAVNEDGIVNRCVNLGWNIVDVSRMLSSIIHLPVRVANDANIAALGEAWMGAGQYYHSIVMITLGTGVGSGIILNGKIWNGRTGAAGEIGHIRVNRQEALLCTCGNKGCLEQYASATGIVRMAKKRLSENNTQSQISGLEKLTAKDVFDSARDGDALAGEVVKEIGVFLGGAIGTVCNVINPDAVLIGGGVSKAGQILLDIIREEFLHSVFHACRETPILLASLGNDAGIYGGVKLILDD